MDKKNILIACRGFYPENSPRAFRATELAKEFALQGHNVVVLTPKKKEHFAFEKKYQIKIKNVGKLKWKTPNFGQSKLGYILTRLTVRLLHLSIEYPGIELMFKIKKALRKEKGYDLLISIAVPYPIHWGVAWAWRKKNPIANTWIADCGDPYMGDKTDSFRKWFYFKYVEKWFMRKVDFISITKESFKVNYYKEFHDKIIEIPQGFKFEEIEICDEKPYNKVPQFAFAGTFMRDSRDPTIFLKYLASLEEEFKFIVYTSINNLIEPFKSKLNTKLEINSYIPREELIYNLSKMDFLVNFEFNPLIQSPSKLIDYGLTKRPILNITSANFNSSIVDEFLNGNYTNQFIIQNLEQYKIENITKQFLKLL